MRLYSDEILKNEYRFRLNRAIDCIRNNYAEDLNLSRLADIACFSRYHFHRIFRRMMGETANEFVRRVRLERALCQLILDKQKSITEIALDCGFSSSQNFARSFKAYYRVTPSLLRTEFNWESWVRKMKNLKKGDFEELQPIEAYLNHHYGSQRNLSLKKIFDRPAKMQVEVKKLPACRAAYVRIKGPFSMDDVKSAFKKLTQWASPRGLIKDALIMGVIWTNPDITPKEKLIFDACITVPERIRADRWVNIQTLPEGLFAVHRCEIEKHRHEEEWMSLILNWLTSSDYLPDDRPGYEIYYSDSETHTLKHDLLDICLPIKPLRG